MIPNRFLATLTIILVLEFLVFVRSQSSFDNLIVATNYGKVKGTVQYSRYNRSFYAFKGIPFAKPPIGDLRFKAPVPPDSWKNIREADKDGPMCIQKNYLIYNRPPVEGKEDCLYLNVFTPKLPNSKWSNFDKRRSLLPVMVFIHYGGFFAGSGNSDVIGPEYFMDKKVILVTFNYRLAVFGFLSTNDDAAPGNWGLKDQVAALKWVNSNINFFGGDKQKVTIFGQSAGAVSVHYHLLSPITKNLFSKAISQSGTTLSLWARPRNELQYEIAKQQALFVKCDPTLDTYTMINCLRNVDAHTLANSSDSFKFFSTEPFAVYAPVTEKLTSLNPNPYITDDPLNLIKSGKMHKVPWIVGTVADEGILRASPLLRQSDVQSQLNNNFFEIGSQILGIPLSVPSTEVMNVWNKITDFFIGDNFVNITEPESVQGFINLYSDRSFTYAIYQSALMHAWKGHNPVWFYNFAYKGEFSYEEQFAATNEIIKFDWGVSHCDDLLYLFPSKKYFEPLKSPSDQLMSKLMIKMWTNFAIYGNPTPFNDIKASRWEPLPNLEGLSTVKNSDLIYLNITGPYKNKVGGPIKFEITNKFNTHRMKFWESLPLGENIVGLQ